MKALDCKHTRTSHTRLTNPVLSVVTQSPIKAEPTDCFVAGLSDLDSKLSCIWLPSHAYVHDLAIAVTDGESDRSVYSRRSLGLVGVRRFEARLTLTDYFDSGEV